MDVPATTATTDASAGFRAVRPVRAYQRIVEQVEAAIVEGRLSAGDRLPSEREMMTTFEVSRPTVREALRVLESSGLVRSRPGDPRGPEVLGVSPALLAKPLNWLVRTDAMSVAELVEFRMVLESGASTLAAAHRDDDQLAEMAAALQRMEAEIERGSAAFGRADIDFHAVVWRTSRNRLLQTCGQVAQEVLVDLVADRLARAVDQQAQMRVSLEHDQEIFAAIRAGDGRAAGRLAGAFVYEYYNSDVDEADRPALRALARLDA